MNNGPEKIDLTDEILTDDGRWVCAATYPQLDHARCYQWRKRPTHDPTAPATPATAAAKGGDIPRTPTDSEMLDWLLENGVVGVPGKWNLLKAERPIRRIYDRAAIAAAMQKGVRG